MEAKTFHQRILGVENVVPKAGTGAELGACAKLLLLNRISSNQFILKVSGFVKKAKRKHTEQLLHSSQEPVNCASFDYLQFINAPMNRSTLNVGMPPIIKKFAVK